MVAPGSNKPTVGDILLVIHDFQARSSDELSLAKGDRVELLESDDEFGDGWFLGKHLINGNSGLFPEGGLQHDDSARAEANTIAAAAAPPVEENKTAPSRDKAHSRSTTLGSFKSTASATTPPPHSASSVPPGVGSGLGTTTRPSTGTDSRVLSDTLNVIDEHITDFNTPTGNASTRNGNDSGSEYSSHLDHRISYIQGEETDEEEETIHTRREVESWNADQVAEYLFTAGVEKHHCEVFREQEITGEVLLGMDQTSVFIKALDLGSVGRRLKTWQKIKQLQDEVNNQGRSTGRNTQNYGSDAGSDAGRVRSRTNTITSSGPRFAPIDETSMGTNKRLSQTPKIEPYEPVSPVSPMVESPSRTYHDKRPSAASVRDLHHSRRHSSSTDFRLTSTTINTSVPSKTPPSSTFGRPEAVSHKKQPSFDRNWTLGGATSYARPASSAGHKAGMTGPTAALQDPTPDLDRGYFSGTDADPRQRNVLKKRDSVQASPKVTSYAEEQRVRSGTALSRHSRLGSVDSIRDSTLSPAAQKYYGVAKRTPSAATTESVRLSGTREAMNPTVTRLDSNSSDHSRSSPKSAIKRLSQVNHPDFNVSLMLRSGLGGLRAASDAITGSERAKLSPNEPQLKESPMYSPARTGSSTPSGGPSFELDSPDATKSPSFNTPAANKAVRKKKQETSAYTRGLQKISPREAMKDADYSGWMKKRNANLMTTWKPRLFVLKGRRLAYYYSESDDQERGLIDISFHRVLPADNERLTGLHATITGLSSSPAMPAGSHMTTSAAADAERDPVKESDAVFIFKLVPPRAGLSRAVNFTKPTVHYFAVPNVKQGRLWMAALMKATIDRDDTQPITTTYQQKTISLAKAQQMRHRPPALMGLEEAQQQQEGKRGRMRMGWGLFMARPISA
ncbi:hypothetical protein N0V88_001033 [Collariella sp. IMI 366227]|nr:hypothetical protein N0V88_001033 [Collariella sp. IMI 366227]